MSKKIITLVGLCLSTYAYSASTEIPNQYHGFWATQEGCRQMNVEGIDAPSVEVKKVELNLPFSSCKLKSIKKTEAQSFSGQYTCNAEGEVSKQVIEISLNDASKLSVKNENDLKTLSICKLKNRK